MKTADFMIYIAKLIEWLARFGDAAMGSFVYAVYAHFFYAKPLLKNIVSFFIGVIVSIYASTPLHEITGLRLEFVSFVCGLTGMKLVETILDLDYKGIIIKKINDD